MNMELTQASSKRGRSTSRSASKSRSRSRSLFKGGYMGRPYKSLRLNGEYKLSRTTNMYIPINNSGFVLGLSTFAGIGLIFSPQDVLAVGTLAGGTIQSFIPNYAEIAALWERVRIDKVDIEISSRMTDKASGSTGTTAVPVIYYAEDNNDIYGNTLAITQQQAGCRTWHATSNLPDLCFTVRPKYQRIVYYTAAVSSFEPSRGFVVADTAIPHYGLRLAVELGQLDAQGIFIRFKYHYSLKDVK